jgi:hypothetical protein
MTENIQLIKGRLTYVISLNFAQNYLLQGSDRVICVRGAGICGGLL